MNTLRSTALGLAIGVGAASCWAGTASSFFTVQITLHAAAVAPPAVTPPVTIPPVVTLPTSPTTPVTPGLPPGDGGTTPDLPPAPVAGGGTTVPSLPPTNPVVQAPPAIQASTPANGICTSQSSSSNAQATVRVVCSTGQFVSIEPMPGRPFAGSHGGAHRFSFGPGLALPTLAGSFSLGLGAGTITAMRIVHTNGVDGPIEMLVSF